MGSPQNYPLNLMAIENCLCEGDKYLRCTHGKGRFKQKFSAGSAVGASGSYLDDLSTALHTLAATWNREGQLVGTATLPSLHLYVRDALGSGALQMPCAPAGGSSPSSSSSACACTGAVANACLSPCTDAGSCSPREEKRARLS